MIEFLSNLTREKVLILINTVVIIAACKILSPLFSYLILKIFNWKKKKSEIKENPVYTPLKTFFGILGIYIGIIYLKNVIYISQNVMDIITKLFRMTAIITIAVALANSITKKSKFILKLKDTAQREMDDSTLKLVVRIIKVVIYIIAGFMVVSNWGYNVSGVLTGLGLGSVVITIAAQDTIKNFFGGLMIFIDRPFKVGEYIRIGETEGTVEDITFRSTRIRTLKSSLVQIPNSEASNATITNISRMKKRRYTLDLGIVLHTDLKKILDIKRKILDYLDSQPNVIENSAKVFLGEIGSNEFKLNILCYLDIIDYYEFLALKENLNFGIMNLINENNIELAYETRTVQIKNLTK